MVRFKNTLFSPFSWIFEEIVKHCMDLSGAKERRAKLWLVCLFLPDLVSQFVLRSFVDIVVTVCFIVEKGINTFCLIYISCSLPNFSTEN